jgi:preprotein translocase subunit SecA
MSLYKEWLDFAGEERNQEEYDKFWTEYFKKEQTVYEKILSNHTEVIEGKLASLSEEFDMTPSVFTGYMDGINSSLVEEVDLESLTEDSDIKLAVDFEKLYYNMLDAKADWLYNIPAWDEILTADARKVVKKEHNKTKTVVKSKKIGRNDPCPCGSGKKYKKCCMNKEDE